MACGTALVLLVKGIFFDGGLHGYWGWIDEALLAWIVWNAGVWFIRRIKGKGDVEVTTPQSAEADSSQRQAREGLPYTRGAEGAEEVKGNE